MDRYCNLFQYETQNDRPFRHIIFVYRSNILLIYSKCIGIGYGSYRDYNNPKKRGSSRFFIIWMRISLIAK